MVKNPDVKTEKATIHYHDIGEYLTREEKLNIVSGFKSFANPQLPLKKIEPNKQGDWLSFRNDAFDNFTPLEPEKKFDLASKSFFNANVIGVATNRDAWVNNFSRKHLIENITNTLSFYNGQITKLKSIASLSNQVEVDKLFKDNEKQISWTVNLKKDLLNAKEHKLHSEAIVKCLYRPFCKTNLYYHKSLIERPGVNSKLFPNEQYTNVQICITGVGGTRDFSALVSNHITDLQVQFNGQIFPLYYYEENTSMQKGMFDDDNKQDYIRRDAISDFVLERAKKIYGKNVTKEDIFYYVYGFLHSNQYKETFASDLKKMLPRLPLLEDVKDFWAFSKAGRKLAELHLNYETVAPFAEAKVMGDDGKFYTVEKLRFPKKDQKDTIIYNSKITISNIPAQAYEYVVNGKSAIEWIMERYQVSTHKESGITNNPNDWATETGNPRYILDLLLSVINVSVQTVEIVNSLPNVKFD